jgi:hypothetical protein
MNGSCWPPPPKNGFAINGSNHLSRGGYRPVARSLMSAIKAAPRVPTEGEFFAFGEIAFALTRAVGEIEAVFK